MKSPIMIILLTVAVAALFFVGCAPSDTEIREMVRAEIAKIEIPAGQPGPTGPQGERGDVGPQGELGDVGSQGEQGDVGPQGELGDVGSQGEQGDVGPRGELGDVGPRGELGDIGFRGDRGDVGPRGEQGPRGDVGPQGEPGPKAEIPDVLEVKQLIVRDKSSDRWDLRLTAGDSENVATITWHDNQDEVG